VDKPIEKPVEKPTVPTKPSFDYTYAPRKKILRGTFTFNVVAIKWNDRERHQSEGDCKSLAAHIKKTYFNNSRGLLKLESKFVGVLEVPFNAAKKNYNQAEKYVKAHVPKADFYVINNGGVRGFSSAGGDTARFFGVDTVACHELGHLLGFGHTGIYEKKDGKLDLDRTGERQSFMGRFATNILTFGQYYNAGWIEENEAALFDMDSGKGQFFKLKRIAHIANEKAEPLADDAVYGVVIKLKNNQRDATISFPKCSNSDSCVALHLMTKAPATQQIQTFGNEYYDDQFTGLYIKKIGDLDTNGNMTIYVEKRSDESNSLQEKFVDDAVEEGEDMEVVDLVDEEFEMIDGEECQSCLLSGGIL